MPTKKNKSATGRVVRYREIADTLAARIDSGEWVGGRLLPSESSLAAEFLVSRVTVRRALEDLRDRSLVGSRQGYGWFVAADPLQQSLGRLGTIESQLTDRGSVSRREVVEFGFVDAPERVREVLSASRVLQVVRVNYADELPFARVTVWCPEELGSELSRAAVEKSTIYDLLPEYPASAEQRIVAAAIEDSDAELLGVPTGSPVLRCERISKSATGDSLLLSEFVFPAHLTEFLVELPNVSGSVAPSGMRLLE